MFSFTYEVVVEANEADESAIATELETVAKRLGRNVEVNLTDSTDLDDEEG